MTAREALEYIAYRDYIVQLGDITVLRKWMKEFVRVAKEGLKDLNKEEK